MNDLQILVDQAEPDELLQAVDGLVASRRWDALADLAGRCRQAVEVGRQLWGVAIHIDYRLALEGPPVYAARVLRPGAGRFALGPLTEVAASAHTWAALAPHLSDPVVGAAVAQERVLRGEDLGEDEGARSYPNELPLHLAAWEPAYPLPAYRERSATFPQDPVATLPVPPPRPLAPGRRLPDDDAARALRAVVEAWVSQSSGRAASAAVRGEAGAAVAELTDHAGLAPITTPEGLALLQWAGASGGAYGQRPGGAAGRFAAWWAAAALAGLDWPAEGSPDDRFVGVLGDALSKLRWHRWAPPGPPAGWRLRLAVANPVSGLAWAINATDHRDED